LTIEKTEERFNATKFFIFDKNPHGEPDEHRAIVISHAPKNLLKLPLITREKIDNLPHTLKEYKTAEIYEILGVATVVFINDYDRNCGSWRYREGANMTTGPYLLSEYKKYIVRFREESVGSQCNLDHKALVASFIAPTEELLREMHAIPDGYCTNVSAPGCADCPGSKISGFKAEPFSEELAKELKIRDTDIVPDRTDPQYGRVLYYKYQ
jgi:hypothetical protein